MKKPLWCCHLKASFIVLKSCARDLRSDVDSYSQLWISAASARWLHSFVWRWWRARAAALPRRAKNESLDCSWTLKPLNVERRRLQFLRPCLHFCLSLNPTFLLWGIFEKRAERGFSVLLMQPPTREQRIPDSLYLFSLVLSHLMKNTLAFFSLIWQALHFILFNSTCFILIFKPTWMLHLGVLMSTCWKAVK